MSASRFSVEVIEETAAILAREEPWRSLAEESGNAFVTPEWYRAYVEVYGDSATPMVGIAHSADGAVGGLLPFVRERGGRLRFGGSNLGDLFHPLPAQDADGLAASAAEVLGRGGPGAIVLDNVEAGAEWPEVLRAESGRRLVSRAYRDGVSPFIDLRDFGSWDDYLASRSKNARSQLRRYGRRLREEHEVSFRRTERAETLSEDLGLFFRLHLARWATRGGSSSDSARVRAFHERFASAALERGWLRLWFLEIAGEPVAAWYGWSMGGKYAYYLAGFDPRWAEQRVGHVLLCHTISDAIEEGAREYDMLLGDETYKARFATGERHLQTLIMTPALSRRGVTAAAEVSLWRLSRRLDPERRARAEERLSWVLRLLPGRRQR